MEPRELLTYHSRPSLDSPVMIAAFRGWNDAGDAATFAAIHMAREWDADKFASVDAEEFYDFQAVRPQVELIDGVTRKITWPANEFWSASAGGSHDVILLVGTEPNTKWRTFSEIVVSVARQQGVQLVVTLGALLADVPHSRPVHITGTAADATLVRRLGLQQSRYEGPTGIVGVLHDALSKANVDSASLWAAVPHYLAVTPNPKAALALVGKASELIGVPVDISTLTAATATYEERVSEMVETDEDVQNYVRMLEERSDEREGPIESSIDPAELPSGEEMAAELERYLREQGDA